MGFFTIYCAITGIALEVDVHFNDEDMQNTLHPYYKCNKTKINSDNNKKYGHLDNIRVVLKDSTISEIGYHDGYGRVNILDSDKQYQCSNELDATINCPFGIAISNSAYILMQDNNYFQGLINNNLYEKLQNYSVSMLKNPFKDVYNAQYVSIATDGNISPSVLWAYIDPQLIEKIEEPLIGKTLLLKNYRRLNGKKSKILYQQLIDKFFI